MPYVLVVDDYEPIRNFVTSVLRREGHSVLVAESGDAAVQIMTQSTPSLVLLDIGLPGLSGWDVLRWMRRQPTHADVPVIVMTGREDGPSITLSWRLGCTCYLTKPFTCRELTLVASRVLGGTQDEDTNGECARTHTMEEPTRPDAGIPDQTSRLVCSPRGTPQPGHIG